MWRDEKTAYLRKNRDYSSLLNGDDAEAQTPRGQNRGRIKDSKFDEEEDDDVSRERQEYLDRRRRLKELERQKLIKGKNGLLADGAREQGGSKTGQGGISSRGDSALGPSKDKKKLPYDRGFGSFFGPSEPVVAKRIIEEARAREQAEIVAAREAKASYEAERKRPVSSSAAGKSSRDSRPIQRPPKPADPVNERARKLKEARDYSFLYDDSPLPDPKIVEKKGPASSKLGGSGRHDSASVQANNPPLRKPPVGMPKGTIGARNSDRPTTSSATLQSQSKSLQPSRPLLNQATQGRYTADKSAVQIRDRVSDSIKALPSKVNSTGPGRPNVRKDTDLRKEAMMRKLVAENGQKRGTVIERRPMSSLPMDRLTGQTADRRPFQPNDRPSIQTADRRPPQGTYRGLVQSTDRHPAQVTSRGSAQSTGGRPVQLADRRLVASKTSERHPVVSQGFKKGAAASATYNRPAAGSADPRRQVPASKAETQRWQPKSVSKGTSRSASSGSSRARYSDDFDEGENRRKRARGLSDQSDKLPVVGVNRMSISYPSDEEPAPRGASRAPSGYNRAHSNGRRQGETRRTRARNLSEDSDDLPVVGVNSIRLEDPSDGDDSFIDDDDDTPNVSSMIQKIMGYNPNKYRGNDDFDDRSMEVGFRAIQAEERRSAREARLEDERELALIEAEEKAERLRKAKKKGKQVGR